MAVSEKAGAGPAARLPWSSLPALTQAVHTDELLAMAKDLPWPALIFMGTGTTALTLWIEVFALKQVQFQSSRALLPAPQHPALLTMHTLQLLPGQQQACPPRAAAEPRCCTMQLCSAAAGCAGLRAPAQRPGCIQEAQQGAGLENRRCCRSPRPWQP